MRSENAELTIRAVRRHYYFEDPKYRKWSDLGDSLKVDLIHGQTMYSSIRDDTFFAAYLLNNLFSDRSTDNLRKILDKGHEQPINWDKFYAYFDEQMDDYENRWPSEITRYKFYSDDEVNSCTVKDLLDEYREKLLAPSYDII